MAVVCAIIYGRAVRRKAAIFYSLWAAAIILATLLTRQHYIVDVLAGGILGLSVANYFAPKPHRVRNTQSTDRF
jgi:membrane-associated phospholipid phosphatase